MQPDPEGGVVRRPPRRHEGQLRHPDRLRHLPDRLLHQQQLQRLRRRWKGVLFFTALATVSLVVRDADACTDAGRGVYGSCYDAGAWAPCTTHGDCTSAQRCYYNVCICASACPFDEICEDAGCHCAKQPLNLPPHCAYDSGLCGAAQGIPGFVVCGNPDASTPLDGGTKDAGSAGAISSGGGCALADPLGSAGGAGGPAATLVLVALVIARRKRR